jgi:LPXTG-motif cell wall-anchored protein
MRTHSLALRGLPVAVVALFGAVAASGDLRPSFQVGASSGAVLSPGTITIDKVVDNAGNLTLPSVWTFEITSPDCGASIESPGDPGAVVASRTFDIAGAGGSASIVVEANQFFLNGDASLPCTYQVAETAVAGWTTSPSLVQTGITTSLFGNTLVTFTNASPPPSTLPPTTLAPTTLPPTTLAPTTLPPTTLAPTTIADPTTLPETTVAATTTVSGSGAGAVTTTTAAGSGVAAPTSAGPTLPATGGEAGSTLVAALLALGLGGGAVIAARRRTPATVVDRSTN